MLNKLFSKNPADKKLQSLVGIVLSALVLLLCFMYVFCITRSDDGIKSGMYFTMGSFAEYSDTAILNVLNIFTIIISIGSIVMLALPLMGVDFGIPSFVNWLPGIVASGFQGLSVLIGWFGMMDKFDAPKVYTGPSMFGWLALVLCACVCTYSGLRIKNK